MANSPPLISVSMQFSYSIYENTFLNWTSTGRQQQQLLSAESGGGELAEMLDPAEEIFPEIKRLPFGALQDSVE